MTSGYSKRAIDVGSVNMAFTAAEPSRRVSIRHIIATITVFLLACNVARADWFVAGAQYSCEADKHLFELSPYSTWSGLGDVSEHTPLKNGFRLVKSGSPITCELDGHMLRTTIKIIAPYDGNGMGSGLVEIVSMKVGAIALLSGMEYLDWDAQPKRDKLIRVRVTAIRGELSIERCYGEISLANNEVGKEIIDHCDSKPIETHSADMLPKENAGSKQFVTSFDCRKEGLTNVETAICKDEALSNMDTNLDAVFAVAKVTVDSEKRDDLIKSQKAWLSKRNLCDNTQCLEKIYDARIKELSADQNVQDFVDDLPTLLKESDGSHGPDQKCRELPLLAADNNLQPEELLRSFREFLSYVPSGSVILDFKCADIKGDGSITYLLVTRKPYGHPGVLTLFSRQRDGKLHVDAQNGSIIQTDAAGASGGYEGIEFHSNEFTVSNSFGSASGGSSFSFTFQYQKSSGTWMLKSADLDDNEGHHHEAPKNTKFQDLDGTGYPIALP